MLTWEHLRKTTAPDGIVIELRRRGQELLIVANGLQLMSSEDDVSSKALADLGCAHINRSKPARVLIGGLGMGFSLRAALDWAGKSDSIEVAELIPAVVEWNRELLGHLAQHPLEDSRTVLHVGDVADRIRASKGHYDAILLDVDNGPDSLAHDQNESLYGKRGLDQAWIALRPGGALAVWSFSDDPQFTKRLERRGYSVKVNRVSASGKGRGRYHYVWVARRS